MTGSQWIIILGVVWIIVGLINSNKTSAKWMMGNRAKYIGVKLDPAIAEKSLANQIKNWRIFLIIGIIILVGGILSQMFNSHP